MTTLGESDLQIECLGIARRAKTAARVLATAGSSQKNDWLMRSAAALRSRAHEILKANAADIQAASDLGQSKTLIDRLTLTPTRVDEMADALLAIRALPDPIGEVVQSSRRPNGLEVVQTRVSLGVILFIYESRPNVTADSAALCVKSGNAVILRGGAEAIRSNQAVHRILAECCQSSGLPADSVQLVQSTERDAVGYLLSMPELIDLVIPRGGESLIRRVAGEARMPVLKHFQGNCHVYVDSDVDQEMAVHVVLNAKTQRPGVCNAAETLLVHQAVASSFLPKVCEELSKAGVELRGDDIARALVPYIKPIEPSDWDTEFLDLILAVGVVDSLESAIEHIASHGSGHTEAILTRDLANATRFVAEVDSSCVIVNASTRFNDGGQLGLGAEIGISTDKYHARGPCGLRELTSTKWMVFGNGHIRT